MKIRECFVKTIIAAISIAILISNVAFAYESAGFKIDISSKYKADSTEDSFTDSDGRNVNINVMENSTDEKFEYTDKELEEIVSQLDSAVDKLRDEYKATLKETYGDTYDDEIYSQLADSIKINQFLKKEVTTFGKGNYKCFHIVTEYNFMDSKIYMDQYTTNNGKDLYTLTLSAFDPSDFDTDELKNMVSSFEFTNKEESKPANALIAGKEDKVEEENAKEIEESVEESIEEVPSLISQKEEAEENSILSNELLPIVIAIVIIVVIALIKMASKNKKAKDVNKNDDNNDSPIQ